MSESPEKVAKTELPAEEYFLAFDIERVGSAKKYGVLAVGTCFGTRDGEVIEKRAFCGKVPPPEGFDASTLKFWSGFPDVLKQIDEQAVDNHMHVLHAYLVQLEQRFGPFGKGCKNKLRLVSDNPGYDALWCATMFFELFGDDGKTISEMFTAYVPTDDPSEQQRFLFPSERRAVEEYAEKVAHTHFPSEDAEQHFLRQCALETVARERQQKSANFTDEMREQLRTLVADSSVRQVIAELIELDK
jgi:hypothetical protein